MVVGVHAVKSSVSEELNEIKMQFGLLERERKSFYEISQATMAKNKLEICTLREENQKLALEIKTIGRKGSENSQDHHHHQDHQSCEKLFNENFMLRKKLDKMKSISHKLSGQISELVSQQDRFENLKKYDEKIANDSSAVEIMMRRIQNRKEKFEMQLREAKNIKLTYERIKSALIEESLTYNRRIEAMEDAIKAAVLENKKLEAIHFQANSAKEQAIMEFNLFEEAVTQEKALKQSLVQKIKEDALQLRSHSPSDHIIQEKETREETFRNEENSVDLVNAEKINLETIEKLSKIREATGVMEISQLIDRLEKQQDTRSRLLNMKNQYWKEREGLITQLEACREDMETLKLKGREGGIGTQMLEEIMLHNSQTNSSLLTTISRYVNTHTLLSNLISGIQHLIEKLNLEPASAVAPDSTETMQEAMENVNENNSAAMLHNLEMKLVHLIESRNALQKEISGDEFTKISEPQLPKNNVRIKFDSNDPVKLVLEQDSDDGEGECLTRQAVKYKAQLLLELKKKKPGKHLKKNKKKN